MNKISAKRLLLVTGVIAIFVISYGVQSTFSSNAKRKARVSSPDVEQPLPLPILAKQAPDRRVLEDPTARFWAEAAQKTVVPQRTKPAPFQPARMADPFENREAAPAIDPTEELVPLSPGVMKKKL